MGNLEVAVGMVPPMASQELHALLDLTTEDPETGDTVSHYAYGLLLAIRTNSFVEFVTPSLIANGKATTPRFHV